MLCRVTFQTRVVSSTSLRLIHRMFVYAMSHLCDFETLCLRNQRRLIVGGLAHRKAVALIPSAPCSLERTVSASARIKPAQPLRILRYMLSISMDYFIARSTSHETCVSLERCLYLFADH